MEGALVRYWMPEVELLEDLPVATLSLAIAYRPESGKRYGVIQARSTDGRVRLFEVWLEADAAEQVGVGLAALRPWFGLASSTARGETKGTVS